MMKRFNIEVRIHAPKGVEVATVATTTHQDAVEFTLWQNGWSVLDVQFQGTANRTVCFVAQVQSRQGAMPMLVTTTVV